MGNKYANYLVPEFKKAIYVLQNLETYGKSNGPMVRPGTVLSDEA
jgi:parvulin-like peptidyl-prolyl isomerase